jgi:endonuclease/exonuclease/phosphatase family metal-dependent hydrolase
VWNIVQLRRVLRPFAHEHRPVVLMGDLNMGAPAAARASRMRSLAAAPTFPANAPRRQLDHILARGPLPPHRSCAAHHLPLSDHRALSVDL